MRRDKGTDQILVPTQVGKPFARAPAG